MIYDLNNTVLIGKPVAVYDAKGNPVPYVVRCDTETGLVQKYVLTESGRPGVINKLGNPAMETVTVPAPLSVVPLPEKLADR